MNDKITGELHGVCQGFFAKVIGRVNGQWVSGQKDYSVKNRAIWRNFL
jgi:hypothetical protein